MTRIAPRFASGEQWDELSPWLDQAAEYRHLIQSGEFDSQFLREAGLIPNLLDILGPCDDSVLLDAGTGTGWLFDYIKPKKAFACDIVVPARMANDVVFEQMDVHALEYRSNIFDTIVASLLLIYCHDLSRVASELFRVAGSRGGRLIVSLMHPYFYRTGVVTEDGSFLVTSDLSKPREFEFKIADRVGPFTYFYRTLPIYLNTLIAAGWRIKQIRDWFVDIDEYQKLLDAGVTSRVRRSGRVPLYTFFECEKWVDV